jgi:hypothetical protein
MRFPRNNTIVSLAKQGITINSPIGAIKYIKGYLSTQIALRVNGAAGGPIPTINGTIDFILATAEGLVPLNIGSTNQVLEAAIGAMVPNASAYTCQKGGFSPLTNRAGFNALTDMVAHAKDNPAVFNLGAPAQAFLARLQPGHSILRYVMCEYNEGSPASPYDPAYVCDNSVSRATVGTHPFARSLRECPCNDAQACGQSPVCEWIPQGGGGNGGTCISNVRNFHGQQRPRFGRRARLLDGTEVIYARRGGPGLVMPAGQGNAAGVVVQRPPNWRYYTMQQ